MSHLAHGYASVAVVVTVVAVSAAIIDRRERRIPNRLVLVGFVATVVAIVVGGLVDHRLGDAALGALAGVGGYAAPLLALHLASPGAMGFGDVKLGVVLGAGLGAGHPVLAPLGLLYGIVVAIVRRVALRRLDGHEAFAPALAIGLVLALATGGVSVRALGLHWFS